MDKPKIVPNFSDKPITNLNKTVTTVTAIKAAHNCLSLEKTNTFNCQNISIFTFIYYFTIGWWKGLNVG